MLNPVRMPRGFTLMEVLITIAIVGIVVMLGLPSFASWNQNQQLRLASEAALNGLQTARAEAIRRNFAVQIVFGPSTGWTVREAASGTSIMSRAHEEGSQNAVLTTTPTDTTTVTFTPLGGVTTNLDGTASVSRIDFTNPTGGTCTNGTPAGPMRCLRVTISGGGTVKMCDPVVGSTDPRACPS